MILHHPQRCPKLQRPADHPAIIVVFPTTFLHVITGFRGGFVNLFSIHHLFLCTYLRPFVALSINTWY